jgi:hypothetical protein
MYLLSICLSSFYKIKLNLFNQRGIIRKDGERCPCMVLKGHNKLERGG